MNSKQSKLLEEAKAHCYSWRVLEAYNIFRRYFDRLPFAPEPEHAEYIGWFVRVLFELGKEFELKIYLTELENHYERSRAPHIAYPLGVVYSYSGPAKMEAAKAIFEEIVRNPEARQFHPKSKMMLADYYKRHDDILACKMLIDSIDESECDATMRRLVGIWKALVLRHQRQYAAARTILETLLDGLTPDDDWYSYFSARLNLALVYVDEGNIKGAQSVIAEVKNLFASRRLKMVQEQINVLEERIREKTGLSKLKFTRTDDDAYLIEYLDKSLPLTSRAPADKLLLLLIKKGFLDKGIIVKSLYDRQYSAEQDDKLVYYHVHTLRKRLKAVGLPSEAILSEGSGYRFVPEVEVLEGEW